MERNWVLVATIAILAASMYYFLDRKLDRENRCRSIGMPSISGEDIVENEERYVDLEQVLNPDMPIDLSVVQGAFLQPSKEIFHKGTSSTWSVSSNKDLIAIYFYEPVSMIRVLQERKNYEIEWVSNRKHKVELPGGRINTPGSDCVFRFKDHIGKDIWLLMCAGENIEIMKEGKEWSYVGENLRIPTIKEASSTVRFKMLLPKKRGKQ